MDALKIAGLGLLATSFLAFARPSFADAPDVPAASAVPQPVQQSDGAAIAAPAAVPEPASPPAPAALPALPALPAMPAVPPTKRVVRIMKWQTPDSVRIMKWEGSQAEVDAAMDRVEIDKAVTEAKISDTMARAMAKVRPEIDKAVVQAIVNAKIDEAVARAIAKAQPEIDKAVALAKKRAAEAAARHGHAADAAQDRP